MLLLLVTCVMCVCNSRPCHVCLLVMQVCSSHLTYTHDTLITLPQRFTQVMYLWSMHSRARYMSCYSGEKELNCRRWPTRLWTPFSYIFWDTSKQSTHTLYERLMHRPHIRSTTVLSPPFVISKFLPIFFVSNCFTSMFWELIVVSVDQLDEYLYKYGTSSSGLQIWVIKILILRTNVCARTVVSQLWGLTLR